jgi:hypothetical protein
MTIKSLQLVLRATFDDNTTLEGSTAPVYATPEIVKHASGFRAMDQDAMRTGQHEEAYLACALTEAMRKRFAFTEALTLPDCLAKDYLELCLFRLSEKLRTRVPTKWLITDAGYILCPSCKGTGGTFPTICPTCQGNPRRAPVHDWTMKSQEYDFALFLCERCGKEITMRSGTPARSVRECYVACIDPCKSEGAPPG